MWLHLLTSVFSLALLDSTSDSESLYLRLAASVMWRGTYMQPRYWRRVCKTGRLTKRLCGAMCEPSTADASVERWLLSVGFHVKTSVWPGSGQASTGSVADCGRISPESLGRFNPGSYSLKMCQVSLLTNQCEEFLETFPRSGSMRNGSVFPLPNAEQPTSANGCSSSPTENWPTPDGNVMNDGESPESAVAGSENLAFSSRRRLGELREPSERDRLIGGGQRGSGRHRKRTTRRSAATSTRATREPG